MPRRKPFLEESKKVQNIGWVRLQRLTTTFSFYTILQYFLLFYTTKSPQKIFYSLTIINKMVKKKKNLKVMDTLYA